MEGLENLAEKSWYEAHGQEPASQVMSSDEDVPQDEEDEPLVARNLFPLPGKQPASSKRVRNEYYCDEEYDNQPDLHSYFEGYAVTPANRIKMCRSYASYLSSLAPAPKPKKQGTNKRKP